MKVLMVLLRWLTDSFFYIGFIHSLCIIMHDCVHTVCSFRLMCDGDLVEQNIVHIHMSIDSVVTACKTSTFNELILLYALMH